MATTTNYGWETPDDTDLVKDGALAIRTLGNAIDSTVYGLNIGLKLIEKKTFTSVTSFSFSNDVFTSTYDNYRLLISGSGSTNQTISIRLRAAGSDNTSSNYQYRRHGVVAGANFVDSPATTTAFISAIADGNPLSQFNAQLDIISPKLTEKTRVQGLNLQTQSTDIFIIHYGGQMTVTTSYDSLTITSASNMTGTARLYGYSN